MAGCRFSSHRTVINPLFHEFYFTSVFKIELKIGSFRLPTHSRDAHRNFFWWSLLISKLKFRSNILLLMTLLSKGLMEIASRLPPPPPTCPLAPPGRVNRSDRHKLTSDLDSTPKIKNKKKSFLWLVILSTLHGRSFVALPINVCWKKIAD